MNYSDYVVGIDVGGTNLRIGIVTEDGLLRKFERKDSSLLAVDNAPLKHLASVIREFTGAFSDKPPMAIAAGFPSAISKDRKIVYTPHNMGTFRNLNVVDYLEAELGVPVILDRDANFLLAFDKKAFNLPEDAIILGFYIGTGYGNSLFIYGNFLEGKNGTAGELGHIPVHGSTEQCSCGNIGCIEMQASGKRLKQISDELLHEPDIKKVFTNHGSNNIIRDYLDWLAVPVAIEANILDPDYVVMGGGVVQMENFPRKEFEELIHLHLCKPFPSKGFNILYSGHNHESGVLGAAYRAFRKLGVKGY